MYFKKQCNGFCYLRDPEVLCTRSEVVILENTLTRVDFRSSILMPSGLRQDVQDQPGGLPFCGSNDSPMLARKSELKG